MKKLAIALSIITALTCSAYAAGTEPLLLNFLPDNSFTNMPQNMNTSANGNAVQNEVLTGTFVPASALQNDNMVPQNNAAKGLPVVVQEPRIMIETKQGTRTNTQWNPGGKGTKSYF